MKASHHGGARKGAGRKRKDLKRVLVNFTLAPEVVEQLRAQVSPYQRSMFVQVAIEKALGRTTGGYPSKKLEHSSNTQINR